MTQYDYLRKHALKNVFISPTQDKPSIIQPVRITPQYGRKEFATVGWTNVELPDTTSRWHVYQIGGVHPIVFNYFLQCDKWTSFAESCNEQNMMIDIYTGSGLQFGRFETYYKYTYNNNLIVALKINKNIKTDYDNEPIFIRVYSNIFYHSVRAQGIDPFIQVYGQNINNQQDINNFFNEYNRLSKLPGLTTVFKNGVMYPKIYTGDIKIKDTVELVYDGSIYKVKEWLIDDLEDFESVLDQKRKYLLHYNGESNFNIDYQDDIDVYLVQKFKNGKERAIYHHKNYKDSLRNLTHRDYSVVPVYIRDFTNTLEKEHNPRISIRPEDLYIRLHIRKPGVVRTVQYEHNRIRELYKLSDTDIVRAMLGLDSTVENWRAFNLENSDYVKLMESSFNDVTIELAEKAYRYNAASKYIGDTPVKITPNQPNKAIELPLRARHGCTVYEYDQEGILIGWHHHYTGLHYFVQSNNTAYIEAIIGWGGDLLDEYFNQREIDLNEVYTYRVYLAAKVGNKISSFEDVTGSDKYEVIDNRFRWLSENSVDFPVVRSDARFFAKDYEVNLDNGSIRILLTSKQNRGLGFGLYKLIAPLGQIDVFLNGRSLIRGLDYFYKDYEVVITNKEFLIDPLLEKQKIHIRFTGFCKKDFTIMDEGDIGFIEHGYLSNNNRYDIRDDKVQRVIIGGKFYHKEELKFSEDHNGVSITDIHNGKPYMVKDVLVPVKPYTVEDTYALREQSLTVDKMVSDYMTLKKPQPPRGNLMAITRRWQLFSPFMTKIIMDLRRGFLPIPITTKGFTRQEILKICKPYEYLLATDPIKEPHAQDIRYVVIHPHPMPYVIQLELNAYRFLQKVNEEYCKGLVSLSPSVKTI